jgi:putative oxidoreductase
MTQTQLNDTAAFFLRVALGAMFLAHSAILKLKVFGIENTVKYFESLGLPGEITYVVVAMEVIGGIMLVLGIKARYVAVILSPILIGAIWVHSGNSWVFSAEGGGWEYPAYLLLLCFVQFLAGDGRFALMPSRRFGSAQTA